MRSFALNNFSLFRSGSRNNQTQEYVWWRVGLESKCVSQPRLSVLWVDVNSRLSNNHRATHWKTTPRIIIRLNCQHGQPNSFPLTLFQRKLARRRLRVHLVDTARDPSILCLTVTFPSDTARDSSMDGKTAPKLTVECNTTENGVTSPAVRLSIDC